MSELSPRSFDRPRERPAPPRAVGHQLSGDAVEIVFDRWTLVVAVKASCDGCRDFIEGSLDALANVAVLVVGADTQGDDEWARAARPVVISPELITALDIRWPPFYVLVSPLGPKVVTEGVVFSAAQVAEEIAAYLA
ncbi:MAG TPA: hypothetical protein VND83_03600 [Acidimicrobiales bacterium]|nr:hypothetical protein [Acidimicrobiales bacterium]